MAVVDSHPQVTAAVAMAAVDVAAVVVDVLAFHNVLSIEVLL